MISAVRGASLFVLVAVAACGARSEDKTSPSSNAPSASATNAVARLSALRIAARGAGRAVSGARGETELAALANEPFRLRDQTSGLEAFVSLKGAAASKLEVIDGLAVYPRALGSVDVVHRMAPDGTGTEDFLLLADPGLREVEYRIELGELVAGVRMVAGTIELLDSSGVPRLRMGAPYVIDATRARTEATATLSGCAYDTSPAAPWDRAPIPPGSRACTVRIAWNAAALAYPAALDPAWTTTGSMSATRMNHITEVLTSGKVLVAGGAVSSGSTAELYDPLTGTWAATGSMVVSRTSHCSTLLATGKVFVTSSSTAELYDPATGTFTATTASDFHASSALTLTSGMVFLVTGGGSRLFNPTTATYSLGPSLREFRAYATVTRLADGRVLIAGGGSGTPVATAEIYNPTTGTTTATGSMTSPRIHGAATLLSTNKVLVSGGYSMFTAMFGEPFPHHYPTNAVDLFDPTTGTFTSAGYLSTTRAHLKQAIVTGGAVLIAGGCTFKDCEQRTAAVDIFDPTAGTLRAGSSMTTSRTAFGLVSLPGGRAIAVGGETGTYMIFNPPPPNPPIVTDTRARLSSAEIFAQSPTAASCTLSGDCASGFCVNGVCCSTACTGICDACSAATKSSGADGTCGPAKDGTDPKTACPRASCAAGVQTNAQVCNGAGACRANGTTMCTPYVCSGTVCASNCTGTDDSKCIPGYFCNAGLCAPKRDAAMACNAGRECKSGFCADKVCCDRACTDGCEACTAALKGSGADGTCGVVPAETNPRSVCVKDSGYPASCGSDGLCDGTNPRCRAYAKAGTVCGAESCASGTTTKQQCNETGTCQAKPSSCAPYNACNATNTGCADKCLADSECASTAYCSATSTCEPKKAKGVACKGTTECTSGFCADGVCCDASCGGQCEACNETGNMGSCIAVSGAPRGTRAPCTGDPTVCGGSCDGTKSSACAYKAATETCGAHCESGSEIKSNCDGAGKCVESTPKSCGAFVCGETGCKTTCAAASDCASGFMCKASSCVPARATCTDDLASSVGADGTTTSCGAYKCEPSSGVCRAACTTAADCMPGNVCNAETRACGPDGSTPVTDGGVSATPPSSGDESGCGCRVPHRGNNGAGAWLFVALIAMLAVRARPS